jgi:ribosome biogenesis GTPase / thiamine phosphate phosphatase
LTKIYGWTHERQQSFVPFSDIGWVPARVVTQQRELWHVLTLDSQAFDAGLAGKFRHEAKIGDFPVAGDWVALEVQGSSARIHSVLPRYGTFVRKAAGEANMPQVVGANIDLALLVCALNEDFNPRRLERYIALSQSANIAPLIVLSKADLVSDAAPYFDALDKVAAGVSVLPVSSVTGLGLAALNKWLVSGHTVALLGSSGAGKSTLLNALAGADIMPTADIREGDGRGRHTTTHRELVVLPSGVLILDNPGMRELGLWDGASGVKTTFSDIEGLAAMCRFGDCQHGKEPNCAIVAALETGALNTRRWASYQKLKREIAYEEAKGDPLLRMENKKMWKRRTADHLVQVRMRDRFNS